MSDRNYDFVRNPTSELADADNEISELEDRVDKLEAMLPRWIPVSERLPEHDTSVLISVRRKDGEVVVKEVLFVDWSLPHEPADPRFADDYGGEDLKDVTHWMPLPAPPEVT
jgi:hypothetical protein